MTERERPARRPIVPRWVLVSTLGVLTVIAIVVALVVTGALRSRVEVPDVVGLSEGVARARLAQGDLTMEVAERLFDASEEGTVLEQDPEPDSMLPSGDPVRLVVSAGSEEFEMPDVVGISLRIAKAQLEQLGLLVRLDPMESDAPKDTVLSTNPAPGATVRTSDMVRLVVAAETDASSALLPYQMDGVTIIIDPSTVASSGVDAPMEVTRRLQSLLEASGVDVTITRSATSTNTAPAGRAAIVTAAGDSSAIVGLDIQETGTSGFTVVTLTEGAAPDSFQSSRALADETARQLRVLSDSVTRSTVGDDEVLVAVDSAGIRVGLGSLSSPEDVTGFRDPAWSDDVARAIYRALGERFGTQ